MKAYKEDQIKAEHQWYFDLASLVGGGIGILVAFGAMIKACCECCANRKLDNLTAHEPDDANWGITDEESYVEVRPVHMTPRGSYRAANNNSQSRILDDS